MAFVSTASLLAICSLLCKLLNMCLWSTTYMSRSTKKILDDNPELQKQWTSLIPVGKMGRPEDLMGAVTFLSSDASLYVNGADLRVDGAYTCT
jgi:D-arabinitol 2-dehydrogenase